MDFIVVLNNEPQNSLNTICNSEVPSRNQPRSHPQDLEGLSYSYL